MVCKANVTMTNTLNKRNDFPILADGKICYLDSGASTQKPRVVIDGCFNTRNYLY